MSEQPATKAGGVWRVELFDDDEVQVWPLDDLIGHDLNEATCVCGPRVELIERDDQCDAWMYVHAALDGRESRE